MQTPESKVLTTLGLCRRAGKLTMGTDMICEALHDGKRPGVVLEAADTSENTHKRLTDKCRTYEVRLIRLAADGATLAHAVGKSGTLAAVAVTGSLSDAVTAACDACQRQENN